MEKSQSHLFNGHGNPRIFVFVWDHYAPRCVVRCPNFITQPVCYYPLKIHCIAYPSLTTMHQALLSIILEWIFIINHHHYPWISINNNHHYLFLVQWLWVINNHHYPCLSSQLHSIHYPSTINSKEKQLTYHHFHNNNTNHSV